MRRRLACLLVVWTAPLGAQGRITGTVYDSLITGGPLPQATVIVVGTSLSRVTDARGRFQIDSIPIGPLQLTFFHPLLDSIGIGAGVWDVSVAATGESQVKLGTSSGQTLRHTFCPDLVDSTRTGLVMGMIRDVDQRTGIAGARVSTTWLEVLFGPRGPSSERFEASAASVSSGAYALCGVPLDVPVFVRASLGDQVSGPVEVFANSKPVMFQDLSVSLADSTARLSVDSVLNAATTEEQVRPQGTAVLSGSVRDINGRPISGARVALHGGGGVAVANRQGSFRVSGLPAGTQTLDVRAIGFAPVRRTVDLGSNATTTVSWELDRRAAELPTVTVLAGSRLERNGFNTRRRQGHGSFFTQAQIAKMGGFTALDVLRRASGLLTSYRRSATGDSVRVVTMRTTGRARCIPNLYVDGGLWLDGWGQVESFFMKGDLAGIEVYPSRLTVPPQFDRGGECGSVVIWTRP